jgi:hypothetical protein
MAIGNAALFGFENYKNRLRIRLVVTHHWRATQSCELRSQTNGKGVEVSL